MFGGFCLILPWNHPVASISLLGHWPWWCPGFQKWHFLCKLPHIPLPFGPILLAAMMGTGCEGTNMWVLLLQGVWDGIKTRGNSSHGSPIRPHQARHSSRQVTYSRNASRRCALEIWGALWRWCVFRGAYIRCTFEPEQLSRSRCVYMYIH